MSGLYIATRSPTLICEWVREFVWSFWLSQPVRLFSRRGDFEPSLMVDAKKTVAARRSRGVRTPLLLRSWSHSSRSSVQLPSGPPAAGTRAQRQTGAPPATRAARRKTSSQETDMQALFDIILPVFLVIGAGYLASWRGLLPDNAVDGLMGFTQTIAIPCLLFTAIWQLDLGTN